MPHKSEWLSSLLLLEVHRYTSQVVEANVCVELCSKSQVQYRSDRWQSTKK